MASYSVDSSYDLEADLVWLRYLQGFGEKAQNLVRGAVPCRFCPERRRYTRDNLSDDKQGKTREEKEKIIYFLFLFLII